MKKPIFFLISLFIAIPCIADDCFPDTHEDYSTWVLYGRPACWCYARHCRGDADGRSTFGRPVGLSDLIILKAGFGKTVTELFGIDYGFCGDFDHKTVFGKPVNISDLNILKQYFGEPEAQVPDCYPPYIPYP